MSDKATRPKRKTWKDRRCHHRNPPQTRIVYDFIHCDEPGCWREVLAACGLQKIDKDRDEAHQRAAEALRDLENLAAEAMREANRGGGEFEIEAELAEARAALAELDKVTR